MKKIALLLALILCIVPVLSACGSNFSAEAAAKAAFKARYIDFDSEDFFDVAYDYNLDLLSDTLSGDALDSAKEACRVNRDSLKDDFKSYANDVKDADKYKIKWDVRFSETYGKKDEQFDDYMYLFSFKNTDMEDFVDKIGVVGIAYEAYITQDGVEHIIGSYKTYICYKIDGSWYVSGASANYY